MHAFLMPHSLNQLPIRLWIARILDIVLLAFILTLQSNSPPTPGSILLPSLQNLSSSIISDACVLFARAVVYHFANFVNECYILCHLLPRLRPRDGYRPRAQGHAMTMTERQSWRHTASLLDPLHI